MIDAPMIDVPMTNTQTPATFCIWLQGFLDGAGDSLDANQLATLKAKIDTVFTHSGADPDHAILTERPDPFTKKVLEDIKKQKIRDDLLRDKKWIYEGLPVPQTWPPTWPHPYYQPYYQPERHLDWPPQINC
jgi:hypothetical protein